MTDTLIDFLRHGAPVGGRRFRGDGIDDPLSENGWQQMWAAVDDHSPWTQIVCSPMQRCHAFALALQEKLGIPLSVDERFREVGFGSWEGQSPDDIIARNEAEYRAFYQDPQNNRPAGAEPLEAFGSRVAAALNAVLAAEAGGHILVIAHAGVIRAALGHVMQSAPVAWYRTRIDNASFTRFASGPYGLKLEFHNQPSLIAGAATH
jgi:broad specificity phosphatase PhoE